MLLLLLAFPIGSLGNFKVLNLIYNLGSLRRVIYTLIDPLLFDNYPLIILKDAILVLELQSLRIELGLLDELLEIILECYRLEFLLEIEIGLFFSMSLIELLFLLGVPFLLLNQSITQALLLSFCFLWHFISILIW